jgi:predicted MFS family arabinose efflux permease
VTEGRSLATGIYYLGYYAGGASGAWIAGLAFEGWHWGGSVLSIIVFQGLACAIALRYLQPQRTAAAPVA